MRCAHSINELFYSFFFFFSYIFSFFYLLFHSTFDMEITIHFLISKTLVTSRTYLWHFLFYFVRSCLIRLCQSPIVPIPNPSFRLNFSLETLCVLFFVVFALQVCSFVYAIKSIVNRKSLFFFCFWVSELIAHLNKSAAHFCIIFLMNPWSMADSNSFK